MLPDVSTQPSASDAVAGIYGASYRRLVGVVALAAGSTSEAEECVQEAFCRLLHAWPRVSKYVDPESFLRMIAFRQLSNRRRKARNGVRALLRHGVAPDAVGPTGDRLDVEAALARLPLHQRQVLVLHHLLGLDVAEIARTLDIAPGTVKSRLSRGRAALAPHLAEETTHA